MDFWKDKRVLISGGAGFIGSHVIDVLVEERGLDPEQIYAPRSKELDLLKFEDCEKAVRGADIVLHLAASVGGIWYSKHYSATQFYECSLMNLQLVEAARRERVKKFVSTSSACAYPLDAPCPLKEEDIFAGLPQETNRAYGFAKRMMIPQAEAYRLQYNMDIAVVVPFNAYGPRDNFHPQNSHVIPSLIRKCHQHDEIVVWGDGTPTRDFLYARDFAEGIVLAAERLNTSQPVNIGTGTETRVSDLVDMITDLCGFKGKVIYDATKPKGQPKRVADIEKARRLMGFCPKYSLEEGLKKTIDWYRSNMPQELVEVE